MDEVIMICGDCGKNWNLCLMLFGKDKNKIKQYCDECSTCYENYKKSIDRKNRLDKYLEKVKVMRKNRKKNEE